MGLRVVKMRPNSTGKCPHCGIEVRFEDTSIQNHGGGSYGSISPLYINTRKGMCLCIFTMSCPSCGRVIMILESTKDGPQKEFRQVEILLWPDSGLRLVPPEVESEAPSLANDFREATAVFPKSKKAAAALARRCLQFILKEKAGTKTKDLADQIDEVINGLPSELASNVDAIRHLGNFAAHPIKSKSVGEIVEVEEGEAEWLLDVLQDLFDYYYVSPKKAAERRAAINQKLVDAGKPPLKTPGP
jgi:hypothetical protein